MSTHDAGYEAYRRVRAAVERMQARRASDGGPAPSAYWAEELGHIDYMAEASPLIVRKLRHHAFHLTGIRPYDYRDKGDARRASFEARLAALREVAGDLVVPESPALGGFGYEIDGALYNVDTLKFAEVLAGMRRGGVLDALAGQPRPLVCEVGAGWGGFARQFRTLFPGATYVIVDFAELFLFSATYLATVFPEATCLFVDGDAPAAEAWRAADFVFVPHDRADLLARQPLDLVVNMVSFQEMTGAQVRGYAELAAAAGCPWLYSLNRERSPYNTEIESVSDALGERYALTEVEVLGTDYTSAMRKPPRPGRPVERSPLGYRHLVGRLRADRRGADTAPGAALSQAQRSAPRVVLGMTLYNNAAFLPEALDSLLAQTFADFRLLLLDDASADDTARIAREYEARDPRVRYRRHDERQAMIATWREAAEWAMAEYPEAEYFAWTSDHDRWHPAWLDTLVAALDAAPEAVLAYPVTQRIASDGTPLDKGPRLFDTRGHDALASRWAHMCREGVGAGDLVYGLMRAAALGRAGIFRVVLRPDRLLMAELVLQGGIVQVPDVLWFRRQFESSSIDRQRATLVRPGEAPRGFGAPPWLQHARALWQAYVAPDPRPLPLTTGAWVRMLALYQWHYGWRHLRKTEASHAVGRGVNRLIRWKKLVRHYYHHAVYETLVGARRAFGLARRGVRRAVYWTLVLLRRLGLRGDKGESAL